MAELRFDSDENNSKSCFGICLMGVDVLSSTHRRCCLLRVERHLKFAGQILVTLPRSGEESEKWPSLSLQSSPQHKGI